MYRQLGNSRLSFEDMATVLTEIEASMNSRPLVPMTEDPNDLACLTPAHFLIGANLHALPETNVREIPLGKLDHYQRFNQDFWHHWRTEYLQELQRDTMLCDENVAFRPGQMVVIVDDFQIPVRWPLQLLLCILDEITSAVSCHLKLPRV